MRDLLDPQVWAPRAQRLRQERVSRFTEYLIAHEGQELEVAMKNFSRATGVSMRTVLEYWQVISPSNKGIVYTRSGVIKIRKRANLR